MNRVNVNECGILLLAAGSSSRLGSPKQLLTYKGKTLLRHAIDVALDTGLRPVLVVLGANSEAMEKELESIPSVQAVFNKAWEEGMASSIRCGLEAAKSQAPGLDGLIIMVCDQPFVSVALLQELLHTQRMTGLPVVASTYGDKPGVPALFHKSFFGNLLVLTGDTGARKLMKDHEEAVAMVDFPEGITDIDTINDYTGLQEQKKEIE